VEKISEYQVRRVIHGTNAQGQSTVLDDGNSATRMETPAFTIVDLWSFDSLPTDLSGKDPLDGTVQLTPPSGAAVFRMCAIAPDEEWAGRSYSESLEAIGHDEPDEGDGAHATDTVDVVVVLSGEVYCVVDTHETLLKAGDVVVQNGNSHVWSNRSGEICTVAFVMASGKR
jgi:mannose-6-phosphate isomerase-like protein (cupin superfamily)